MRARVILLSALIGCMFTSDSADARRHGLFNRGYGHDDGCGHEQDCCADLYSNGYTSGYTDQYGGELYAQATPRPRTGWPWNRDDEEELPQPENNNDLPSPDPGTGPEPSPEPTPEPVPDDVLPTPLPEPQPDPDPIPDVLPDHAPQPTIPSDPAELNVLVGKQLGGFVRANHQRNGANLDIYQARGKQRIVWEVAEAADWMSAIGKAFYLKGVAGSSDAGIVLICNDPAHPAPEPVPEPGPGPDPTPIPDPGIEPLPEPPVDPSPDAGDIPAALLRQCGGPDLAEAQTACEAAGLYYVVVRRYGGEVNRVIYPIQKTQ